MISTIRHIWRYLKSPTYRCYIDLCSKHYDTDQERDKIIDKYARRILTSLFILGVTVINILLTLYVFNKQIVVFRKTTHTTLDICSKRNLMLGAEVFINDGETWRVASIKQYESLGEVDISINKVDQW